MMDDGLSLTVLLISVFALTLGLMQWWSFRSLRRKLREARHIRERFDAAGRAQEDED